MPYWVTTDTELSDEKGWTRHDRAGDAKWWEVGLKITQVRLCNFRSFGPEPTEVHLGKETYLTGMDKHARSSILRALGLVFSPRERLLCGVAEDDFHSLMGASAGAARATSLWVECDVDVSSAAHPDAELSRFSRVAPRSGLVDAPRLLRAENQGGGSVVRFRFAATTDEHGALSEHLTFVRRCDGDGSPLEEVVVGDDMRRSILVHHICVKGPADEGSGMALVDHMRSLLTNYYEKRRGDPRRPKGAFRDVLNHHVLDDLELAIADVLQATGAAAADKGDVSNAVDDFGRSSCFSSNSIDSPLVAMAQSLTSVCRYHALLVFAVAAHEVSELEASRAIWESRTTEFKGPALTLILLDEPESELTERQLSGVATELARWLKSDNTQLLMSTSSPDLLRDTAPENVRVSQRGADFSAVFPVWLPRNQMERRFASDVLRTFPNVYSAKLVIQCESSGFELVIQRLIKAYGLSIGPSDIAVLPLGATQISALQRVCAEMGIGHVALLNAYDGRAGGGYEKIIDVAQQFGCVPSQLAPELAGSHLEGNTSRTDSKVSDCSTLLTELEQRNIFFATPFDFDFLMMQAYPAAYEVQSEELGPVGPGMLGAVLGEQTTDFRFFTQNEIEMLAAYHRRFQQGVGLSAHMRAAQKLQDDDIVWGAPNVLSDLLLTIQRVIPSLAR